MRKLEKKELLECNGGGFSIGLCLAIAGGIAFIVGIIDGYIRPLKCN